jgi:hypothetical protein
MIARAIIIKIEMPITVWRCFFNCSLDGPSGAGLASSEGEVLILSMKNIIPLEFR